MAIRAGLAIIERKYLESYMLGIVILNYNTPKETIECVRSIKAHTKIAYKIYIVDNNSNDDSQGVFKIEFSSDPLIDLIFLDMNKGYSAGNNVGIKAAITNGAENIAILNSDIILVNGALDIMVEKLGRNLSAGTAVPSITTPNNEEEQTFIYPYTYAKYISARKPFYFITQFFNRLTPLSKYTGEYLFDGMGSGCCFVISSELFYELGLLDENVFLYYEECILGLKLINRKKKALYIPDAKIIHICGVATGKKTSAFKRYHSCLSSLYYLAHYQNINKAQFWFAFLLSYVPYSIMAIFKKNYNKYKAEYKSGAKEIYENHFK